MAGPPEYKQVDVILREGGAQAVGSTTTLVARVARFARGQHIDRAIARRWVATRDGMSIQDWGALPPTCLRRILSAMSDAVTRLNTALEGRYAIERELGEGGMATVYLADDLGRERKVAHLARMSADHV